MNLSWKYCQQGEGVKQTGCLQDTASPTQAQLWDSAELKESFGVHVDVVGWFSFYFYFKVLFLRTLFRQMCC